MSSSTPNGWLDEIIVVDLTATAPGPYCTSLLARMGARVIKCEPPAGDVARMFPDVYRILNEGKESVVVDLKCPEDVGLVRDISRHADVVIEGWRPGVATRLGVGPADLWALNPTLVYCSLSGYGQTGALRERPGHDLNYVAASGLLRLLLGDNPRPLGLPVADLAGGTFAALRILAGLFATARGAQRVFVDVSVAGAVRDWVDVVTSPDGESSMQDLMGLPHYGVFETADGHFLTFAVAHEEKFWVELCKVLGRREWAGLSLDERWARSTELKEEIAKLVKEMTRTELELELENSDTCWAFVDAPGPKTDIEGLISRPGYGAAELGAHSFAVRAEFGSVLSTSHPEQGVK